MDIDLLFKIAGIGILVAVLNQVLTKAGREDQRACSGCGDRRRRSDRVRASRQALQKVSRKRTK